MASNYFGVSIWINRMCKFSTANTNKWIQYEIPPSRINISGEIIMESVLSDGSICYIFYDERTNIDGEYYYSLLMQDFGWYSDGDKWKGGGINCKLGCMYLNPKRQVAIYFYPKGTYGAFKVKIEKPNNY